MRTHRSLYCIICVLILATAEALVPLHLPEKASNTPALNWNRRNAIAAAGMAGWSVVSAFQPSVARAQESPLNLQELLKELRVVPTFCIVNPDGASYMLIKSGESFAKGYAFTTFSGALAVLGDAERASEKGGYADTWKGATITVVPMDIAMRLALQPTKRTSQKEQSVNTMLDVIPGVDDRDLAIQLDRKFTDQGKTPIFYFNELHNADGSIPVYFNKNDLLAEWRNRNEDAPPPKAKVFDLVTLFQYVLRGKADELPIKNKIVFVPNEDALEAAKELKARGLAPYKADRMIV